MSKPESAALRYPFEAPTPGQAMQIAPGVRWIRLPMPFRLDHINVWAVKDGDGWAVFDTGTKDSDNAAAWRALFEDGGPLGGGAGVTRVFVTHMHPDHVGMAGWLTRKFNCRLWMTQLEYLNCRVLVADTGKEATPACRRGQGRGRERRVAGRARRADAVGQCHRFRLHSAASRDSGRSQGPDSSGRP